MCGEIGAPRRSAISWCAIDARNRKKPMLNVLWLSGCQSVWNNPLPPAFTENRQTVSLSSCPFGRSHEQKASSRATSTAAVSAAVTPVPAATAGCGTPTLPWTSRSTKTCKGTSSSRLAWAVGRRERFVPGWVTRSTAGGVAKFVSQRREERSRPTSVAVKGRTLLE